MEVSSSEGAANDPIGELELYFNLLLSSREYVPILVENCGGFVPCGCLESPDAIRPKGRNHAMGILQQAVRRRKGRRMGEPVLSKSPNESQIPWLRAF